MIIEGDVGEVDRVGLQARDGGVVGGGVVVGDRRAGRKTSGGDDGEQ